MWRGTVPFLIIVVPVILDLPGAGPGHAIVVSLTAFLMFFVAGANLLHFAACVGPPGGGRDGRPARATRSSGSRPGSIRGRSRGRSASTRSRASSRSALGGLLGLGLGESRAAAGLYLPNACNDFIFAVIGEEFGLVGAGLVIVLFVVLAYQGVRIALYAPDTFGALMAAGITTWLCVQAFINIGVVVAFFPITGITLPFISAGGSSLIVSLAAVGILLSISRETVERGTWNDASADRGRRNGRAHLPGPGGRPVAPRRRAGRSSSAWLGGHRGLEAAIVRDAGIPIRLLALRSLRSVDRSIHLVLDPIRLAVSVPQATAILARERPAAILTTGGYVAIPVLVAAACSASRRCSGRATSSRVGASG